MSTTADAKSGPSGGVSWASITASSVSPNATTARRFKEEPVARSLSEAFDHALSTVMTEDVNKTHESITSTVTETTADTTGSIESSLPENVAVDTQSPPLGSQEDTSTLHDSALKDPSDTAATIDLRKTTSTNTTNTPSTVQTSSTSSSVGWNHQLPYPLQRELTNEIVERISIYSILHDMNKEVTQGMSLKDPLPMTCLIEACGAGTTIDKEPPVSFLEEKKEDITMADGANTSNSDPQDVVLIDEEEWFLQIIQQHDTVSSSILNYRQAVGEEEVARTQLWKPHRSWWEAKSSKNPWVEPPLHNKRWRYLWPLIHYHKFCTRCIKRLKRHDIDVLTNPSKVAQVLRQDICMVSDHLSAVSKFDSDEWREVLPDFCGWVDMSDEGKQKLEELFETIPVRSLSGRQDDGNSPILRSQVNARLLKTLADTQKALEEGGEFSEEKIYDQKPPSTVKTTIEPEKASMPPSTPFNPYSQKLHDERQKARLSQEEEQQEENPYWYYPQGPMLDMNGEMYMPGTYGWVDPSHYYYQHPESYSPMHHLHPQVSPYWAHLDHATAAMGLETPTKKNAPRTPRKKKSTQKKNKAQPPLIHHPRYPPPQFYGYAYGPPSPATQFMMSPQANRISYKYQHGHSPAVEQEQTAASNTPSQRTVSPTTSATESESTVDQSSTK